jgi:type IV pilus assembly protein PilB
VILVGEIRDAETATIAIESALTGHLVLSTLHTNDSSSAVTRLVEMGVEPFLVSSSVACVLAQRLARRLCPDCKQEYEPPKQLLLDAGYTEENLPKTIWKAVGCRKCGGTGYRGRLGLHEVLLMTEEISHLCVTGATSDDIKRMAVSQGMLTLRQDGLEKARNGDTSVEEVARVVV